MKKKIEEYYSKRAKTYHDLDKPKTIVAAVRSIGVKDHTEIISLKKEEKILDIGCGTGRFLIPFSSATVVGTDFTLNMLKEAKKFAPVVRADAEHLPFKEFSFDVVHSAGLLGVYRSGKVLEEAAKVTKKRGRIYVSFPATKSVSGLVAIFFMKFFRHNPSLLDFWYTEKEIKKMLPKNVEIKKIYRLGWELPFQRWYKKVESKWLVDIFLFSEKNLREMPIFKYFGARLLVESVRV